MSIDWEWLLDADGEDLQDAYDDLCGDDWYSDRYDNWDDEDW